MEMYFQDLNVAIPRIQKHFAKYPSASISAMFRSLRKSPQLSSFGDYLLISTIARTMHGMDISVKKSSLRRAFRQSSELKGQITILNQLLSNEMAHDFDARMPQNRRKHIKGTIASSKEETAHE